MAKIWNDEMERQALRLKGEGMTYKQVGNCLGVTACSVKHKIRRLCQASNHDKYKHTFEKVAQAQAYIKAGDSILETHCGRGGMTAFYAGQGCKVECYDIVKDRVNSVNEMGLRMVTAVQANSEKELNRLVYAGHKYDVIDVDPYGLPSRYFPSVFELIEDGLLFLTFPALGVAQINKITVQHYRSFWGFVVGGNQNYLEAIQDRLFDFAFMAKRAIEVLEVKKIDRIYRLVIRVERASLCDIVGLKVDRAQPSNKSDLQLDIFGGAA